MPVTTTITNGQRDKLPLWVRAYVSALEEAVRHAGNGASALHRMSREAAANITVHLANEHGVDPGIWPVERHHIEHAFVHVYGIFRQGREHVHETPGA